MISTTFDKHEEDNNIDFYYEHNVPKMLSREGPKAAVGDVNGDGLDDIYIGGTSVHAGQLYLQTADGRFVKKEEPNFDPSTILKTKLFYFLMLIMTGTWIYL